MRKETKSYMYPAHGTRVCQQMLSKAKANGEVLCCVEKDFLIGTGITFRMFFNKGNPTSDIQVKPIYGKLRDENDPQFENKTIVAVTSMKAFWFPLGYYYFFTDK